MNDSPPRPRRSPSVVLLDALLGLVTAVQTGNMPGRRRAGLLWLAAGVLVVAGGTTILIGALMRAPGGLTDLTPPEKAAPAPPPVTSVAAPAVTTHKTSAAPTASATPVSSSPAGSASAKGPAGAPASSAGSRLTAAYAAAGGTGLLGYQATVTLAAQGPGPSADWRLTVTLPRSTLQVAAVDGATVEREGAVWTFTPDDSTRQIAAGATAVISFEVRGATLVDAQPTDCRVGDEVCSGLSR
ncbi:hypothetical protein ACIA5D_06795 [Actinoplanes sp. NPDC051513]|uniref:hypothetical protein n=1 Tax=Actinoplanes sp. NPDC051513 TaxID=3363908 RepID=UPI00378F0D91